MWSGPTCGKWRRGSSPESTLETGVACCRDGGVSACRMWAQRSKSASVVSGWSVLRNRSRVGARADRSGSSGEQNPHGLAITAAPRLGRVLARRRLAGGPHRIELVRFGAVTPRRAGRAVDLGHGFALLQQEGGQASAIAAVPSITQSRRPLLLDGRTAAPAESRLPRRSRSVARAHPQWGSRPLRCGSPCAYLPRQRNRSAPPALPPPPTSDCRSRCPRGRAQHDCDGSRPEADRLLIRPTAGQVPMVTSRQIQDQGISRPGEPASRGVMPATTDTLNSHSVSRIPNLRRENSPTGDVRGALAGCR